MSARDPNQGHGGRAHSRIGPSAAHRWSMCPGSVRRSVHIPNKSTVFAKEGTAAHEFVEHIMVTRHEPRDFLHGAVNLGAELPADRFLRKSAARSVTIDRDTVFAIDEEMVEGAELYRDTIYALRSFGDDGVENTVTMFEQRLDLSHIHADFFGTGDAAVYDYGRRRLRVIDYKYGRGLAVEIASNEQLLSYAIGYVRLFESQLYRVDEIELIIVQPRAFHAHGPVRRETWSIIDLVMFEDELKTKAAETDREDAAICVGEQCKWCPISYACPELRTHIHEVTGARFSPDGELTDADLPDPLKLTQDQLGRVMRQVIIIENWMRAVMAHAHDEAINGRIPTGMKLVDKRAYRVWSQDEDATALDLELAGMTPDQFMTDPQPELKSVAQVEKVLGKKLADTVLDGLFTKKSSGTVLALIEDAREAVAADRSGGFGAVEDE